MIKLFATVCFSMALSTSMVEENIYSHSVMSIEGVLRPLGTCQGKKVLIVTLPIQQNASNDSLLSSLDSLRAVYNNSLVIIGVPSYEDGYTPTLKESLKQWYRSKLSMDIIVTEGLYTRKSSGNQQNSLFKWLTNKNRNEHFDKDVEGPRFKFVVWTDGELVAVLGAQTRIGGNTMQGLLQQ